MPEQVFLLLGAAFLAGLVDAMGGGGGLVQVPALFSAMGHTAPAMLFGTNKLASIWGTGAAACNYARLVHFEWNAALPATLAAFVAAFCGAYAVTWLPGDLVRKLLPFILFALLVYTWRSSQLGLSHAPMHRGTSERLWAVVVGAVIGFYDGFFGPGTGSFLIFLFVRFFGFDFLRASAVSKVVNVACNLAALLGSRLALRHGSYLVRKVFLVVVGVLILKSAHDAFLR